MRAAVVALVLVPLLSAAAGEPKQKVTIEARDRSVREVLKQISRDSGRTIALDGKVDGKVTLTLRDVSWRDAALLVAERAGCKVEELKGGGLLVTRVSGISVQLSNADIRTALLLLARLAGKSIVIGPEVTGRVTLELKDVSAERALNAVATTHGYAVVDESGTWTVR